VQKDPCLKSPLAQFLYRFHGVSDPGGKTFECEYFREFESEFENNLGYESGIHMGSIYDLNKKPKILCYCPFNVCVLILTCLYIFRE
jgi:hypothetical protein